MYILSSLVFIVWKKSFNNREMGKDQELLEAARNGNVTLIEKILYQKGKRSGPLAR